MNRFNHLRNLIEEQIIDISARCIELGLTITHEVSRATSAKSHSRCAEIIEELALDINQWDALHQNTLNELRIQQESIRRLYAAMAPLAENPLVAEALLNAMFGEDSNETPPTS